MKFIMISILAVMTLLSCSHSGLLSGVQVKSVKPNKVLYLEAHDCLNDYFDEVSHCCGIQIINDTILVLHDMVNETSIHHFKVYSINSLNHLGSLIQNGRGYGEMLSPHIIKTNTGEDHLYLKENSNGQIHVIDVIKSIETKNTVVDGSLIHPSNLVDWLPLPEFKQFLLQKENNYFVFHVADSNAEITDTFNLYDGIDVNVSAIYLSSFMLNRGTTGEVATVMAFLPQINLIDTDSKQVKSIAVNDDYHKWDSMMNSNFDMNTVQYYMGATSTPDYLFASYRGMPINMIYDSESGMSIHVFDWHGNFLYDLRISDNVSDIAYDSINKKLYCLDASNSRVLRYDMSGLGL